LKARWIQALAKVNFQNLINEEYSMSTMSETTKTVKTASANKKSSQGFSDDEKVAMKERAREVKAEKEKQGGESALLAKIDEMSEPDRSMAARLHQIVKTTAPDLSPKTWYGMPAYANKDGKIVCFFQPAEKFNYRYATLGFNDAANLDDGSMWPTVYALKELTPAEEARIAALVKKAVS
jgi:uncharacterized protein YdhG (YjbR/CyaY superfamily)